MLDIVGTLVRLGLAAVWLISGWLKVIDLNQSYVAVEAYDLLPAGAVSLVSAGLPFLELALGVLVLLGLGTRVVAVASAVVLLGLIAAVSQAWARGLTIDCGCFGGGGAVAPGETQYPQEVARDIGFLLLAAWLIVRPRTLFSLDGALSGGTAEQAEPDEDDDVVDDQLDDVGENEEGQAGGRSRAQRS
ncbi:methylamine utilization protein MauE [Herbihabitans rhizosphaerae]|uniref:Methylamine utilization protein MauE n=1 Tax=Herbihabitans rhizosphaerae TaxID=1872711 RepID=A0A4Q7KEB7_9PSEU|nr:methylamine utilization protein MauE [Herbihabitans rhizosphaerae]